MLKKIFQLFFCSFFPVQAPFFHFSHRYFFLHTYFMLLVVFNITFALLCSNKETGCLNKRKLVMWSDRLDRTVSVWIQLWYCDTLKCIEFLHMHCILRNVIEWVLFTWEIVVCVHYLLDLRRFALCMSIKCLNAIVLYCSFIDFWLIPKHQESMSSNSFYCSDILVCIAACSHWYTITIKFY